MEASPRWHRILLVYDDLTDLFIGRRVINTVPGGPYHQEKGQGGAQRKGRVIREKSGAAKQKAQSIIGLGRVTSIFCINFLGDFA
jgi:hypothetical protein